MDQTLNLSSLESLDSIEGAMNDNSKLLCSYTQLQNIAGHRSDSSYPLKTHHSSSGFNIKGNNLQVHLNPGNSHKSCIKDSSLNNSYSVYNSHHENDENQNDENYLQPSSNAEISMEVNKKYFSFTAEQVQCELELNSSID